MKKNKKGKTLEKKLKAYSAAVAGTLLLAPAAHATVQYSGPQNLVFNAGNPVVPVDMNGDGVTDFNFFTFPPGLAMSSTTSGGLGGSAHINSYPGAPAPDPANLPSSYSIRNTLTGTPYWTGGPYSDTLAAYPLLLGNFYTQGSQGYIGVRFDSAVCTLYGWIQFRHDAVGPPFSQGTVIDWAYEDTCNTPIHASDTGPAPAAVSVPTLNQWGIMILIAFLASAGTWMLRKKEEV